VSKEKKAKTLNNKKYLESAYPLVAALLLCIVLGLIFAIDTQAMVDGSGIYRTYANLASWTAAISALYSLLGVFILKRKASKVILGIGIFVFAGLFLYGQYAANFIITW